MVDREAGTQTGPGPRSQWRSSKLRDSCQACAVSKVKCPKQKPACSRCESRNIACEYFFTKRPGRRRENSTAGQKTTASSGPATPEPISGPASNTELDGSWTRYADTIHALQPIPRPYFLPGITTPPGDGPPSLRIPASPRIAENMSATNGSELFSVLANMNATALSLAYFSSDVSDMDFITSGMESPPELSMQDVSDSSSSSNTQSQIDVASLLMPVGNDTHASDSSAASESSSSSAADLLNAASGATPPPSNITQRPTGGPLTIDTPTPPPSCGCLARALDLLKTLSSTNNPNSPASATLVGSDATVRVSDPVQTRTVLQKNKQGIEAVEGMLACSSCTHDSFLLTVLATAVLKILELYSAAASSPPPHPGVEPEADDKTTRQAKLVLSELHRAQRVVNKLSPKLKAPPSPERSMPKHGGSGSRWPVIGEPLPASGLQTISPFSVGTLEMVANDVRNCLGTLSAELINNLRQI